MRAGRLSLSTRVVGVVSLGIIILLIYSQYSAETPPVTPYATNLPVAMPSAVSKPLQQAIGDCEDQRSQLPMAVQIKKFWGNKYANKPKPSYPSRDVLITKIHQGKDPFDNFPVDQHPFEKPSMPTHLTTNEVKRIFNLYDLQPHFVVEVGSYVGGSALRIVKALDELNVPDVAVLCIDTWLGTATQWLWKDPNFKLEYGRPGLYNQFMVNVINNEAHHHIVPLVATGATGAHLLKAQQWQVDFLYLDAAHEVLETFREVCLYFEVLAVNGVMAGDDYESFPAVKHDVDRFVRLSGAKLVLNAPTWHIVKTPEIQDFTCWDWI
jgi:hypothetical protein